MTSDLLRAAMLDYIAKEDSTGVLTDEMRFHMANSLAGFVTKATAKFIAGQCEHGGDIRDRNLSREISNELMDFFWYHEAGSWPRRTI